MGGPGSTRWSGYEKKTTVEECIELPIRFFTSRGLVENGETQRGIFKWRNPRADGEIASVTYEVDYTSQDPALWLFFECQPKGERARACERIGLDSTSCNFGGKRWWMRCPSPLHGRDCENRRCGKLYLPPDAVFFACRECHELTYRSCQRPDPTRVLDGLVGDLQF
jgi:hypothetical protein